MSRYDEDFDPPRVKHIPIAPPRAGTPGEGIYLRQWQAYMAEKPKEFAYILRGTHRPRQRAASVAASFMVFMGCNGGSGFTHMAEDFASRGFFIGRESAFLAAWAIYNKRERGMNTGLRVSEFMLAATHPTCGGDWRGINWKHVPAITQDDHDYLEGMVKWWASEDAANMRQRAAPLIQVAQDMQRGIDFGRSPLHPKPEVDRVKRALESFAGALA